MQDLAPDALVERLNWRYAVKKFDAARKIPATQWSALESALVLSPSSFGLQPWRFLVVEDPAVRERLVPASWKQRQVADASHLVVFAIRERLGAEHVDRFLARMAQVRGVTVESLASYRKVVVDFVSRPGFDADDWAARQVYIALGGFMTAAALTGIDTCPMEGLEPERYDEILGLPAQGLRTVVACCAGYRAADDAYAAQTKVRYEHGDVVAHV
jgi:nitroreductase